MTRAIEPYQVSVRKDRKVSNEGAGRRLPTLQDALELPSDAVQTLRRISFPMYDVLRPHEAQRFQSRLERLNGVEEARVDPASGSLHVGLVGQEVSEDLIRALAADKGLRLGEAQTRSSQLHTNALTRAATLRQTTLRVTLLTVLALLAGGVTELAHEWSSQTRQIAQNIQAIVTASVVLWAFRPTIGRLVRNLRARHITSNTLTVAVGVFLAVASLVSFALGREPYFEAAILALGAGIWVDYLASELSYRARLRLYQWRRALGSEAHVLTSEGLFRVGTEDVSSGDTIVVREGQRVPADGKVVKGSCFVEANHLARIEDRRQCVPGDEVWAGSLVMGGTIAMTVANRCDLSALARMARHLEAIGAGEGWLWDRVSRAVLGVTVVALCLALGVLAAYALMEGVLGDLGSGGLKASIACLLVTAPMAFARVYDPSIYVTIGRAAEQGAFFKDMASLARAGELKELYVSRTGVLTVGKPELDGWVRHSSIRSDELLGIVLGLEEKAEHPVGKALSEFARSEIEDINAGTVPVDIEYLPARGVRGRLPDGRRALLGNRQLMIDAELTLEEGACLVPEGAMIGNPAVDCRTIPGLVVYLAIESEVVARIHLSDPVRGHAKQALNELHELGVTVALLTGDTAASARHLSEDTGVKVAGCELRHEEIVDHMSRRVEALGDAVGVVGDPWRGDVNVAEALRVRFGSGMGVGQLDDPITIVPESLHALYEAVREAKLLRRKQRWLRLANSAYCLTGWSLAALGALSLTGAVTVALFYSVSACFYSYRGELRTQ